MDADLLLRTGQRRGSSMSKWSVWDHETGNYYGCWDAETAEEAVGKVETLQAKAGIDTMPTAWYVRTYEPGDRDRLMPIAPAAERYSRRLGKRMVWLDGTETPIDSW